MVSKTSKYLTAVLLLAVPLAHGCGHKQVKLDESANTVTKANVISVSVPWVKFKGNKVDFGFNIANESAVPFLILFVDTHCYKGTDKSDSRIVIDKVYANPSGDGYTQGAVVATNIEWKYVSPAK